MEPNSQEKRSSIMVLSTDNGTRKSGLKFKFFHRLCDNVKVIDLISLCLVFFINNVRDNDYTYAIEILQWINQCRAQTLPLVVLTIPTTLSFTLSSPSIPHPPLHHTHNTHTNTHTELLGYLVANRLQLNIGTGTVAQPHGPIGTFKESTFVSQIWQH